MSLSALAGLRHLKVVVCRVELLNVKRKPVVQRIDVLRLACWWCCTLFAVSSCVCLVSVLSPHACCDVVWCRDSLLLSRLCMFSRLLASLPGLPSPGVSWLFLLPLPVYPRPETLALFCLILPLPLAVYTWIFQLARLGGRVGGGHPKDRHGWLREVATARDALGVRRAAVQLEEALFGEQALSALIFSPRLLKPCRASCTFPVLSSRMICRALVMSPYLFSRDLVCVWTLSWMMLLNVLRSCLVPARSLPFRLILFTFVWLFTFV